ncbi:MAG: hypothetical protein SGI73_09005 [Chloroflexota bacterium]|nr:hypothetical protein [Chloroflexota bacterium]
METIRLRAHIGADGLLCVQTPVETVNIDYDVVIIDSVHNHVQRDDGWAFINAHYGGLADDPIMRPTELPFDQR